MLALEGQMIDEWVRRATLARREDRPEDAKREWTEAIAICRREGARLELARSLKGLGQIERDQGDYDAALGRYEEALVICRESGPPLMVAHTVRHVGDIHVDAGRADLAEPLLREALLMYRAEPGASTMDVANAVRSLAVVTGDKALWEEARGLYESAGVREGVEESLRQLAR